MKRRRAAHIAASAFAMVALAAAGFASLYSCNLMMPSANYPIMRQEKGFSLLRVYAFPTQDELDELGFGFGALDGMSSQLGGGPDAFVSLRNKYSAEGIILHLSGISAVDVLNRNGVFFDEKRISYNSGVGFLSRNDSEIIRLTANLPNILANNPQAAAAPISGIESNAFVANTPLRAFAGNVFTGIMYRGLFDDGAELTVQSVATLPPVGAHTLVSSYPNAMDTIVAAFSRLTDAAYPDSAFWTAGKAEIRRFGFTETGAFSWFEALRRDDVADDEEALLVAVKDDGSSLRIRALEVAGTAGKYVLAWEKNEAPGFRFAVLDASLNTVNSISVYGIDAVYLGEALVMVEGVNQNAALFASLGTRGDNSSSNREVVISIIAYPTAYLKDGPP